MRRRFRTACGRVVAPCTSAWGPLAARGPARGPPPCLSDLNTRSPPAAPPFNTAPTCSTGPSSLPDSQSANVPLKSSSSTAERYAWYDMMSCCSYSGSSRVAVRQAGNEASTQIGTLTLCFLPFPSPPWPLSRSRHPALPASSPAFDLHPDSSLQLPLKPRNPRLRRGFLALAVSTTYPPLRSLSSPSSRPLRQPLPISPPASHYRPPPLSTGSTCCGTPKHPVRPILILQSPGHPHPSPSSAPRVQYR